MFQLTNRVILSFSRIHLGIYWYSCTPLMAIGNKPQLVKRDHIEIKKFVSDFERESSSMIEFTIYLIGTLKKDDKESLYSVIYLKVLPSKRDIRQIERLFSRNHHSISAEQMIISKCKEQNFVRTKARVCSFFTNLCKRIHTESHGKE